VLGQYLLESDHGSGVVAFDSPILLDFGSSQTGDQSLDQTLFNGSRNLGMRQDFGLCFGQAARLRMQAPQPAASRGAGRRILPAGGGERGFPERARL
jgi:hypothetical protein